MSEPERTYVVTDLEVTIRNTVGKNRASPFCFENYVVMEGLKYQEWDQVKVSSGVSVAMGGAPARASSVETTLVGQNLKFDIMWYLRHDYEKGRENFLKTVDIWDTQLAEYLLTGQDHRMWSLDKLAQKYGGTLKDDRIKEYWNSGVDTCDIPEDELVEYLKHDVMNTELVFQHQVIKAHELGMMPLVLSQMRALKATCMMEFNGMQLDTAELDRQEQYYEELLADINAQIFSLPTVKKYGINPASNDDVSVMLFGGFLKRIEDHNQYDEEGNLVRYKSGVKKDQIKTKKVTMFHELPGLIKDPFAYTDPAKKAGFYKVDSSVLERVQKYASSPEASKFCSLVLEYRDHSKQLGTYVKGFRELMFPDGRLHGNLIHTNTKTGRLSSSQPNLQNLTNR